ncbi:hypothetical protein P280DRAFT_473617 [Massarina eburnea CBS 473.64]|uniref:Uncharacterized protein n=1 Tax=Massarina eburnea CBS 473.64 TaxID=1395130 RepID=A0A6A6RKI6_9PLEO|nr:hypothetical protein P280DRAFT_473617 [Massarina eburnea CBS 473.64]
MPSNGDAVLNPIPPSTAATSVSVSAAADLPTKDKPAASRALHNGNRHDVAANDDNGNDDDDDDANESEAETVVLDAKDDASEKVIKRERSDDDLRSVKQPSRVRSSPSTHSRRPSRDESKTNGRRHGSDSPSSRTTSRHTKDTSPDDSQRSPVRSVASPPPPSGRGRSASTLESRKRKVRDDVHPKHSLEPPRQKAKTEGLRELRQPSSPATPGLARPHKRSQSTQSFVTNTTTRRRRDLTALAVTTDRKQWSDESSGESSSPRPSQTPNFPPHTRLKRAGHRAVTSPARAMAHGRKLDKYGATQLSRESERGNLIMVKAAYEAAPEELNHADFAGFTPLQKAALQGHVHVVEFLIDSGCRTDCESNLNRDTPLIDAVENGHLDVIKLLLDKGHVNPHHQNKKGQRAIDVLDHELDDAEDIEKELKVAMRRQVDTTTNEDYTQSGLSQTKSASRLLYNEYNTETLVEKAGDGDILAVGELINSNIKPNIACGVAASRGGHYDILSILLASGLKADPDPSKHSETPMLVAIGRGHIKIVNLLLEQDNFDPTRRNREGKAYWEISEDRQGPKWEQERSLLKKAYDNFKLTHKSPKRNRKEPPAAAARLKRKTSPARRERTSSPRPEPKRAHPPKSTTAAQAPQKSRRLMSGKEMANREVKRRRRVVDDEDSEEEDSDDEVRAPAKKSVKPRAFSEGEEHKPVKKIKDRSEEQDVSKREARATSHESDDEPRPKPTAKIRTKVEKVQATKPTPDPDSPDEKKPVKNKIRSKPLDETKMKKRRASNDSIDDVKVKKTPTASAKSTPAPPEKASTPDSVRERKQEEQKQAEKQAAETKRKAAEEAARKHEEEEAARKAAEEEEMKAEAEAKRIADEAEAAHRREEEEARQRAAEVKRQEELETKRQEALAARQNRIANLPRALRRACELGTNRPLHFSGEELGISAVFLPLFYASSQDLHPEGLSTPNRFYIPSFQVAGILGLRELDLAHLGAPYCTWERIPFTPQQRDLLLRQYDVALLAQDFRFPMEGTPGFDYAKIQDSIKLARQQFMGMEGLYWVDDRVLFPAVEKVDSLRPLLGEIADRGRWRRVSVKEVDASRVVEDRRHRPRKSFMDTILKVGAVNGVNGVVARVNGDG